MTKRKSRIRGKIFLIVLLTVLLAVASTFLYGYMTYRTVLSAATTEDNEVIFTVDDDMYGSDVVEKLYENGLIQNVLMTKIYLKLNSIDNIIAGDFTLNTNMSVSEIFEVLTDSSNVLTDEVSFTIIPGDWAKDVASTLASITQWTADEIMDKWNDIDYIATLIDKYDFLTEEILASEHCYLEGYLAPDTYIIYASASIETITEKILAQTDYIYTKYEDLILASDLSIAEIYTLASIVQFEANSLENMQLVAGVFYNRLEDGWLLGSSVTICYALYEYDSWTDCESNSSIESAYNTYKYAGLPVGAICNPSENAIYAVLYPADTNYYYFIAVPSTGEMYFAETFAGHQRNINKYLN